jgi:hypothetical protein
MSPRPRRRAAVPRSSGDRWLASLATVASVRGRLAVLLLILVPLAFLLGACSARFDPAGPCTSDGSAAGAYPDLEAQVPRAFRGTPPGQVDSGRACSPDGLGTLQSHGITELRFAGSTWTIGTDSGLSLAMFRSEGPTPLTRDWLVEFYETGAKSGKNVESVDATDYPVSAGVAGRRLDVLNGESFQSVVVWERGGRIETAIVANFIREIQTRGAHDQVVRDAVDAWNKADAVGK